MTDDTSEIAVAEAAHVEQASALAALQHACSIRLDKSHAEGEGDLYYVIDTHWAEPEVNHPGALVGGPLPLDQASALAQAERADILLRWRRGEEIRDPYRTGRLEGDDQAVEEEGPCAD